MKKHTKQILAGVISLVAAQSLWAQDLPFQKEQFALTVRGGLQYNIHSGSLQSFQNSPDCGVFESGKGIGFSGLLGLELPIAEKLTFGVSLGFMNRSATFTNEGSFAARDTSRNQFVTVQTENAIATTPLFLDIYPEVRYTIIENLINGPVRLMAAGRIGVSVGGDFDQQEEIISPDNAAFRTPDGRRIRTRELAQGNLSDMAMPFGLTIGVEHALRIGEQLHFTQQLAFDASLSDIAKNTDWKAHGLRFELGLRYAFLSSEKEPVKEVPPVEQDTTPKLVLTPPPPPQPFLGLDIRPDEMKIVEYTTIPRYAMLPFAGAVFFDSNSADIISRYNLASVKGFATEVPEPTKIHRNILRILARMMLTAPDATLKLTGSTSGISDESGGLPLARRRAEVVRDALVQLGVPANRITTEAVLMPKTPSNPQFREGRIDNRRVDFEFSGQQLSTDKSQRTERFLTGLLRADVRVRNLADNERATLKPSFTDRSQTFTDDDQTEFLFRLPLDSVQQKVSLNAVLSTSSLRDSAVAVIDLATLPRVDSGYAPLRYDPFIDMILAEPFLLFGYDDYELSSLNKKLLSMFIETIPSGTELVVEGSTDTLGTRERNAFLARKRVDTAIEFLRSESAKVGKKIIINGVTKSYLDRNALPEERLLNRSVQVRIKK